MYDSGNKLNHARQNVLQGIGSGNALAKFVEERYLEMLVLLNLGIHTPA